MKNTVSINKDTHRLYPGMNAEAALTRLEPALTGFSEKLGGSKKPRLFSAPGRTEICGNHTDHQNGLVLAAAVALDDATAVLPSDDDTVRIFSGEYSPVTVKLDDLSPRQSERGTSAALVRGIAEYFIKHNYQPGGFNAYASNLVPIGSGLSSSAAFEVLTAAIMNGLFNDGRIPPEEIAKAGQYAENHHYGKPCGLMDQMTVSLGGLTKIDFKDPQEPVTERLTIDFNVYGYALCIIDTGTGHNARDDDYTAIPNEMSTAARELGQNKLREVPSQSFFKALPSLKGKVSDRALLRAAHFFDEEERVTKATEALKQGDIDAFLEIIRESGRSSWTLLQNIYSPSATNDQPAALTLAWCERLLNGAGACRIHGGGFGGTVQAFVPLNMVEPFRRDMESLTGAGSVKILPVREAGGVEILY